MLRIDQLVLVIQACQNLLTILLFQLLQEYQEVQCYRVSPVLINKYRQEQVIYSVYPILPLKQPYMIDFPKSVKICLIDLYFLIAQIILLSLNKLCRKLVTYRNSILPWSSRRTHKTGLSANSRFTALSL